MASYLAYSRKRVQKVVKYRELKPRCHFCNVIINNNNFAIIDIYRFVKASGLGLLILEDNALQHAHISNVHAFSVIYICCSTWEASKINKLFHILCS